MADEKAPNEATTTAETFHRHDDPVAGAEEQEAVTGRPNDTPLRGVDKPAVPNSTFGSRAKQRQPDSKAVDVAQAENKAVESSESKSRRTKA